MDFFTIRCKNEKTAISSYYPVIHVTLYLTVPRVFSVSTGKRTGKDCKSGPAFRLWLFTRLLFCVTHRLSRRSFCACMMNSFVNWALWELKKESRCFVRRIYGCNCVWLRNDSRAIPIVECLDIFVQNKLLGRLPRRTRSPQRVEEATEANAMGDNFFSLLGLGDFPGARSIYTWIISTV